MPDSNPYVAGLIELVEDLAFSVSLDGNELLFLNNAAKRLYDDDGDSEDTDADCDIESGSWL